jgi:hypothetical protein
MPITLEKSSAKRPEDWFYLPNNQDLWGLNESISPKIYPRLVSDINRDIRREKETDSARLSSNLRNAIDESSRLLELTDDWDGEGSLGYTEETLNKAIKFLEENAKIFFLNTGTWITAPDICPGPDGSIDLLWKLQDRELLINIPIGENNLAGYYGDNSQNETITKGKLNLAKKNEDILIWLMK